MKLRELRKELTQNFIYELQHVVVYENSKYAGRSQYYDNRSLKFLFKEATVQLMQDLGVRPVVILKDIPPNFKEILVLKTAILAIKNFADDIQNKTDKIRMMFNDNEEDLMKTHVQMSEIANDYEKLYQELLIDLKLIINPTLYKIEKPEVKEDETLIIKVGTKDRPATEEDIKGVQLIFAQVKRDEKLTLITHHAIEFVVVKTKDLVKTEIK
jgi:hypothetical protein